MSVFPGSVATAMDRLLRANSLPILGIVIGTSTDKATWLVQWAVTPTVQQIAQAASLITTFDPLDQATVALLVDQAANDEVDGNKALQAAMMVTYKYLPAGTKPATLVAFAQEIKQKYKTL